MPLGNRNLSVNLKVLCIELTVKLKHTFILISVALWAGNLAAQKLRVSLEGGIAKPMGWQAQHTIQGQGGELAVDYFFDDNWSLGADVGLREFLYEPRYFKQPALRIKTFEAAFGYHSQVSSHVNVYGKLGMGLFHASTTYPGDDELFHEFRTVNVGFSPKIGFTYRLMPNLFVDMNASCSFSANREVAFMGVVVGFQYDILKF